MRGYGWPVFGTVVLVFLLVIAASIAAALLGLVLGDVGRAVLSWIFDALTQPVAALTASVLYFTLLQLHGAGETPQASRNGRCAAGWPPRASDLRYIRVHRFRTQL